MVREMATAQDQAVAATWAVNALRHHQVALIAGGRRLVIQRERISFLALDDDAAARRLADLAAASRQITGFLRRAPAAIARARRAAAAGARLC
jgi:hypothetical protein